MIMLLVENVRFSTNHLTPCKQNEITLKSVRFSEVKEYGR